MESADVSSSGYGFSQHPNLPPGFRFHPTDEELVVHYLKRKTASVPLPVSIIAEIELYKFDPWELPAKATFGEQEWYFFTPRDRKYPNGARPNRAATSGYWKATGTDKPVLTAGGTQKVGVKKALVFYGGKPPKGIKTNWIMHEYRLADNKPSNKLPGYDMGAKKSSRLDDWVLCRIYKKSTTNRPTDLEKEESIDDLMGTMPIMSSTSTFQQMSGRTLMGGDHNMFDGMSSRENHSILSHKRTFPAASSLYYTTHDQEDPSSSSKNFNTSSSSNGGDHHQNSNEANCLLSHHHQTPQLINHQQQTMLGSLGDAILRPPYHVQGMNNWYS